MTDLLVLTAALATVLAMVLGVTGLAATARVHLCLDDPERTAEFLGGTGRG